MNHKLLPLLLLLFILVSCAAPTATVQPAPTLTVPPIPTDPPTRVVTLSKYTPTPQLIATPTYALTLPAGAVLLTVSGDGFVNVRSGPGPIHPIVGRVASGSQHPAIAQSQQGEWLLLTNPEFQGGQGWVYIHLTDFDPNQYALPVATPAVLPTPTP